MQKKTGEFIVEMYDKYGHKEGWTYATGIIHGKRIAQEHEKDRQGNTAVVYRILYNTIDKE